MAIDSKIEPPATSKPGGPPSHPPGQIKKAGMVPEELNLRYTVKQTMASEISVKVKDLKEIFERIDEVRKSFGIEYDENGELVEAEPLPVEREPRKEPK